MGKKVKKKMKEKKENGRGKNEESGVDLCVSGGDEDEGE